MKQRPQQRPRRAAARHMYHPEIPAPGRQPKDPAVIVCLSDQKRRLAEVLRADCPLDELMLFQDYVKACMRFPVNVRWIDPDAEEKQVVEVCMLGLKEEFDRRGLLVKCSLPSGSSRMIPIEQLQGPWVDDEATWDPSDPVKVASRLISDYCFWVNELHGLDPSTSNFGDDDEDDGLYEDHHPHGESLFRLGSGMGGVGVGIVPDVSGSDLDDEEEEADDGGDMIIGDDGNVEAFLDQEVFDELSSGALSELEGRMDDENGMQIDDDEEDEDRDDDDDDENDDFEDEDLIPLGALNEEEAENDEKNWKLGYDEDLDAGVQETEIWAEEEDDDPQHQHRHNRINVHL